MTIRFEIPSEIESKLRPGDADPNVIARETFLVDLYRRDVISRAQLAEALGVSRLGLDPVLKRYNVVEDLMTTEEFRKELDSLHRIQPRQKA